MPRIKYRDIRLQRTSMILVGKCLEILEEYVGKGFRITLRQLYYQLVQRGIIPNTVRSYKNLGAIVNDARLNGTIDWLHIRDITRGLERRAFWESPQDALQSIAAQYHEDFWAKQDCRIEIWVEKDALTSVIEPTAQKLDVPLLSCRGYTSQSTMWEAAQRLMKFREAGQELIILHLGDHDPSGIDMTRDIKERLEMFMGEELDLRRIALNMDQIRRYNPPPNPAKITDIRYKGYVKRFGESSWELDALSPEILDALITRHVNRLRCSKRWNAAHAVCEKNRRKLKRLRVGPKPRKPKKHRRRKVKRRAKRKG